MIGKETNGGVFDTVVDIGCGTGLLGVEIRPVVENLEGFDISQNMLAKVQEKDIYKHLSKADLSLAADAWPIHANTRAATLRCDDVSQQPRNRYVSRFRPTNARRLFAFSVEDVGDKEGFVFLESLRYAHSKKLRDKPS